MIALFLALQAMSMPMDMPMPKPTAKAKAKAPASNPSGRIEIPKGADRVEIPANPQRMHHQFITVSELSTSTIAYCERTNQTRCENEVSAFSGGTKVVVCKVAGKWLVNKCAVTPAARKK